ncbi:iIsoprene-epoxide--glutathione S-transferase [Pelagibius sp.]|uniref:iIsoprene-epoxide--glutathione S-transferase n=1 Tax=Pelagibius sp. TaxID=1931238 RepID=UPI003BB175C1
MIQVYGYMPGWTVADISPYVSKLYNYLKMADHDFEMVAQPLATLAQDAPRTKLPYIKDDDGTVVPDSTEIIHYLQRKYGDPFSEGVTAVEQAMMIAWNRMIDEHTYWCGVIQPRWRKDEGWEVYKPIIVQGTTPIPEDVLAGLDAFRAHIRSQFDKQGMGLKSDQEVYETLKVDADALSDFLGEKPFFMGDQPRWIDATVYSILTHTIEAPFDWKGKDYIAGKKNLTDYIARMRERFDLAVPYVSY